MIPKKCCTLCVAGGGDAVSDGGDKTTTGGHLSETESEKSWKLIVLPGIERVFAFQVRFIADFEILMKGPLNFASL